MSTLMVDAHGTYTVADAKRFARLVADCDLAWFEEPVTADDKAGMAELRAHCENPYRGRRKRVTRFDFRDLAYCALWISCSLISAICGGITEAMQDRNHCLLLQPATCSAFVGRRACVLCRVACLRRSFVELHPRIFPRRQSDVARSRRRDDRTERRYDRDTGRPGLGMTVCGDVSQCSCNDWLMTDKNLLADLANHLFSFSDSETGRTPSERELAEHFSVSRGQIREALAILEAMRIVERRAKSGIYLTTRQASVDALALFAKAGLPVEPARIYEIVEIRKIHEIKAAELASSRATEENYERLREILRQSEENIAAGRPIAGEDRDFHLEIVRATQNSMFHQICSMYYMMGEERLPVYFSDPERGKRSHAEHLQIFDALLRRDGNLAQALMSAHLQGAESYWKGLIDGETPENGETVSHLQNA